MNKNLILNIITGIIVGTIYHFFVADDIIGTIIFALGFIILYTLFEMILNKRKGKREELVTVAPVDQAKVDNLIQAIGGHANIVSVSHEVSRVRVSLKDIDLIDQNELKKMAPDGAFLSGEHLQMNFGKQAEGMARLINEQIK